MIESRGRTISTTALPKFFEIFSVEETDHIAKEGCAEQRGADLLNQEKTRLGFSWIWRCLACMVSI